MSDRLANKNAVITGGGTGIGLAVARLFGSQGARIAMIDCNAELGCQAKAALAAEGIDVEFYEMDVSNAQGVAKTLLKIAQTFDNALHILVNNAGVVGFASVEQLSLDVWDRMMAVNVTGTLLCSQAALPFMKAEGGAIVNIASTAGLVGFPKLPAYCASKSAVVGLTRQMAIDYAMSGIRVNCLCPGRIAGTALDLSIRALDSEAQTQAKMEKYPIGRFGRPEEVAQAALFLASDEASFITGEALPVDGGMTAA